MSSYAGSVQAEMSPEAAGVKAGPGRLRFGHAEIRRFSRLRVSWAVMVMISFTTRAALVNLPGAAALMAVLVLSAIAAPAPAAGAEPDPHYNGSVFTPQVSVTPSTRQAGGHPELTIEMRHPPNHCIDGWPAGPGAEACSAAYIEQNLRDWTVNLPGGLMADPNAVPQCDDPRASRETSFQYTCPDDTQVGTVSMDGRYCLWSDEEQLYGCLLSDTFPGQIGGKVYNGVPGPSEQGHLYILYGLAVEHGYNLFNRADASVKLRNGGENPDYGIDSITTDIPDAVCTGNSEQGCIAYTGFPVYHLKLTLSGGNGAELGHPLVRNPTFCSPVSRGSVHDGAAGSSFVGYAQNAWAEQGGGLWHLGFGDGLSTRSSAPYQVTGCNSLPFAPGLRLDASPDSPGAAPALTATLSQSDGEQTVGEVRTKFPSGFKINFDNKLAQCADDQIAARACPESSQIGMVEAHSPLLPLTGELSGPLSGEAYIGATGTDSIRVVAFLHGFADVTLEGRLQLDALGNSEAVFTNLPPIPMTRFVLSLFGGDHALVTNPATCGRKTIEAIFTSHQGKQLKENVPLEIACTGADFDVTLGSRRPGAHPTVTLTTKAPGVRSVAFDLSRYLKFGSRATKLEAFRRYGTLALTTENRQKNLKLKLIKRGALGTLAFSATDAGAQVSPLSAYDVRLEGKSKKRAAKRRRRAKGPTRLVVGNLPEGTTLVSLELEGSKDDLIQNPSSCRATSGRGKRRALGFSARIVGTQGQHQILHRTVKLVCTKQRRPGRK